MGANNQWFDEDDDDETGDAPDPSQQLPEAARKAMRRQEKQLKEALDRLSKYEAQERKSALANVLTEKGLSPKVANLLPSDIEATPDAVGKWLEDYADVFGGASTQEGSTDGQPSQPAAGVDNATAEAINNIQTVNSGGAPVITAPTTIEGLQAAIKATTNQAEMEQLIEQMRARGL